MQAPRWRSASLFTIPFRNFNFPVYTKIRCQTINGRLVLNSFTFQSPVILYRLSSLKLSILNLTTSLIWLDKRLARVSAPQGTFQNIDLPGKGGLFVLYYHCQVVKMRSVDAN